MQTINKIFIYLSSIAIIFTAFSCKKFVEAGPPEMQVNGENVYNNDATAIGVLTGIYSRISLGSPSPNIAMGTRSFSMLCGLSADEYNLFTGANSELSGFYKNALITNFSTGTNIGAEYWNIIYDHLYSVNSAIEGLNRSKGLTNEVKQQLLGEAKFIRAFFYFYLVNLYGDVPLVTTTDYTINATLLRSSKSNVYQQIVNDLKDAKELLSSNYLDGRLQKYTSSEERVRPNKWAAAALLARAYLYNLEWANAETEASLVINNALYDTVSLNNVFLRAGLGNKEAIWQLQPVRSNQNIDDSKMFIVTSNFNNNTPVRLSDTLLKSFEINDSRKVVGTWVKTVTISGNTYYYPFKYKNNTSTVTEYLMILRLAEQYLIRAEARAKQNKISEAQSDLNVIRKRAGLANTTATTSAQLLEEILHERQVELFSEWGHRWLDLKRTGKVNSIMSIMTPLKGGTWETTDQLYPIPQNELQRNHNLVQNPGY